MCKKLILILFLASNFLNAQKSVNSNAVVGNGDLSDGRWIVSKESTQKIEGTPYLFKNWSHKGKIHFDNRIYTINAFNYNIQAERFEVKISKDSIFALNHGSFNKVEMNGKDYVRFLDPDFQRNTYFENVINFKGKKLLKKYVLKIKEGQINPMTMQKIREDKFIKSEQFYIVDDNKDGTTKIKLKRSAVMSLIVDIDKPKIKEFVKTNRLSYKKIEDVIQTLNYYKTL